MATQILLILSQKNEDAPIGVKKNDTVVSDPVTVKTHIIWRPTEEKNRHHSLPDVDPQIVLLPLGAFLALIIGTCIKISHWWNEDIREADGVLENVYSAKYPHRPVLARVLSVERDPRGHRPYCNGMLPNGSYQEVRGSQAVIPLRREEPASCSLSSVTESSESMEEDPTNGIDLGQRALDGNKPASKKSETSQDEAPASDGECTPLLLSGTVSVELPEVESYSMVATKTSKSRSTDIKNNPYRRTLKDKRYHRRKRPSSIHKPGNGVSRLVMNSLNFNLNLLKFGTDGQVRNGKEGLETSMEHYHYLDHGFIEDSFIHPGVDSANFSRSNSSAITSYEANHSNGVGVLASIQHQAKPSLSSFSSYATSSTSLSTDFSESRHYYHLYPRSPSPSSDSGASSDIIWELPDQYDGTSEATYSVDFETEQGIPQELGPSERKCLFVV